METQRLENREQLRDDFLDAERMYPHHWWQKHGHRKLVAITMTFRNKMPNYNTDGKYLYSVPLKIDEGVVDETMRHFTNYLDRDVAMGTRRKKEKLPKLFVMEVKKGVPHIHGIIALPEHKLISTAISQIHDCLLRCDYISRKQNRVLTRYEDEATGELFRIDDGWIGYISKLINHDDRVCVEHSLM